MLMHGLYHAAYRPPSWSIQQLHALRQRADATVFYHAFDDVCLVKRLVAFREPVNIGAQNVGCTLGPWGKTPYTYSGGTDPPNFAIYCRSPVYWGGMFYGNLHLLHSIGYAFDTPAQLDYQHLIRGKPPDEIRACLVAKYERVFALVFACAHRKRCSHIALGLVGAGFFAEKYPGGQPAFNKDVWRPALKTVRTRPFNQGIRVRILADREVPTYGASLGFFPTEAVAAAQKKAALHDILFVNAWDPFSMVGNGNGADNSLDGWMGRSSASAYLCWPLTNPAITYDRV